MKQRGRKSGAALSVVPATIGLEVLPSPPEHLTDAQSAIWRMVMASRGGDLIAVEAYPVLVEYCRLVDGANQVAEQLAEFDPEWAKADEGLKRWDKLLGMQDRLTGRITSVATKLRLTPQSRYVPHAAGRHAERGEKRRPWESE